MGYRIVDDNFPSIIINRRTKTMKRIGKVIYDMCFNGYDKGIKGIQRDTGCSIDTIKSTLGPKYKKIKNKKVYYLEDSLKDDIKKVVEVVKKTSCYDFGLSRDKKKLLAVVFYILYIHKD